jgi:hypothetical protein
MITDRHHRPTTKVYAPRHLMISQVHRSAAAGSWILGVVRPMTCFKRPEGVLEIEAGQERLPTPVHIMRQSPGP